VIELGGEYASECLRQAPPRIIYLLSNYLTREFTIKQTYPGLR
jgi:hypothetical protein